MDGCMSWCFIPDDRNNENAGTFVAGFMDYSTALPGKIKVLPSSVVDIIYIVYKACNGKRQR